MRALLIINPCATSVTRVRREVIARALASALDLEAVQTRYRGHAHHVAREAGKSGYDLVLTLGGDGTVNEAVNGLLQGRHPGAAAGEPHGTAVAALPGGNANVFSRALGLPQDPVDATGRVLEALESGNSRVVGLGLAGDRYFCINAGLGFDAEVVRAVEGLRARGRGVSATSYVRAAIRQFYTVTDRRVPALTLERPGVAAMDGLFCGIVSNASPWTYLGTRPVITSPHASFDAGLDLLAMRKLTTLSALNTVRQMLASGPPGGKRVVTLHDLGAFALRAAHPVAFQADGEYLGEREFVTFQAVPHALRVIA